MDQKVYWTRSNLKLLNDESSLTVTQNITADSIEAADYQRPYRELGKVRRRSSSQHTESDAFCPASPAMDSRKPPPVSFNAATAGPSHRRQQHHKPSSSLGSLYEVLADLDETQLHYLIQEMNHSGQNVPVSEAVSAFESPDPTVSLGSVRASMKPAPPPLQRQLSKSQQGKLRLQTAFQRAPSLRQQRSRQEAPRSVSTPVYNSAGPQTPKRDSVAEVVGTPAPAPPPQPPSPFSPVRVDVVRGETRSPVTRQQREGSPVDSRNFQLPVNRQRKAPAYKRIERPDFNLPPGITVTDLLQLLEIEYQAASGSEEPPSPAFGSSTSSPPLRNFSPTPLLLSPTSPLPSPQMPGLPGHRPLRRASSRLDMALDADRSASGPEEIGLGMLEPRPTSTVSLGSAGSVPVTPATADSSFERALKGEAVFTPTPPPIVMEGIFDVLDNQ